MLTARIFLLCRYIYSKLVCGKCIDQLDLPHIQVKRYSSYQYFISYGAHYFLYIRFMYIIQSYITCIPIRGKLNVFSKLLHICLFIYIYKLDQSLKEISYQYCDLRQVATRYLLSQKLDFAIYTSLFHGHPLNQPFHWSFSAGTNCNLVFSLLGKGFCIAVVALVSGGGNLCVLARSGSSKLLTGCTPKY